METSDKHNGHWAFNEPKLEKPVDVKGRLIENKKIG